MAAKALRPDVARFFGTLHSEAAGNVKPYSRVSSHSWGRREWEAGATREHPTQRLIANGGSMPAAAIAAAITSGG